MLAGRRWASTRTLVAYRASNQSIQDLIGGQIKLACDNFAVAHEQVKAGKLRAVSITSPGRYPLAKDITPTAETLPGFELMPAFGWVGPSDMPADIVRKLTDEFVAIGKVPEVRAALEKFGVLHPELPGAAYAEALRKERASLREGDRESRDQGAVSAVIFAAAVKSPTRPRACLSWTRAQCTVLWIAVERTRDQTSQYRRAVTHFSDIQVAGRPPFLRALQC